MLTLILILVFIAPLVAFALQKCVIDTLSPISIKLNFSQADSETANITLNMDSKKQSAVEVCSTYNINIHNIDKAAFTMFTTFTTIFSQVPFEKQCRKNDTCIAELDVNFEFKYVYLQTRLRYDTINVICLILGVVCLFQDSDIIGDRK